MAWIAVDVVLLPSEEMVNKTIEANRELLKQGADKIILDKDNCLPHISLAMGCIDENRIGEIEVILQKTAEQYSLEKLSAVGILTGIDSAGDKVSAFQIERTETLQSLHEEIMGKLAPYFSYDVTADMVLGEQTASESTLCWIRSHAEDSSFDKFFPHITIGYGQISGSSPCCRGGVVIPIRFDVSELALCHLGDNCTCRKILVSTKLKGDA